MVHYMLRFAQKFGFIFFSILVLPVLPFPTVDSGVHFSYPVPSSPAILGNNSSVFFLYLEAFESSTTSDCSTFFSQNIGEKDKECSLDWLVNVGHCFASVVPSLLLTLYLI